LADVPADSPEVWARVNPGPAQADDVAALADRPALTGVVAAKTDSAAGLARTRALLDAQGLECVALMPLVESAAGMLDVGAMAGIRGVPGIHLGEADLAADLGLTVGEDELVLQRRSRRFVGG
jgi:citrate lyase subunit beta / citryl-CoA lyase